MPAHAFHRIAAVHGTAAFSVFSPLFFGSVGTENDVFWRYAQFFQEAYPKLVGCPDVQDFRYPDTQMGAVLTFWGALSCAGTLLCEPCRQYLDRHFWSSRFRP